MVNLGEALVNVVMSNKRRMLTRLGQKARGQVRELFTLSALMEHYRRKGATLPTREQGRNEVEARAVEARGTLFGKP
jgi:hypothetical protein